MPFTIDEFLGVFRAYNEAVWPGQLILMGLALVAVFVAVRSRGATRLPVFILAVLWFWMGTVYHLLYFRSINPAAVAFGALFIIQAAVFVWLAFRTPATPFAARWDATSLIGGLMIGFALVIYPALGWLAGHRYPEAPTFGLPCPTTVFTFGLLLWAGPTLPGPVFIIPIGWSLVATSAALRLGMTEDVSLPVAAIIASAIMLRRRRPVERLRPAHPRTP
jgi:hypothetical protein